MPTLGTWKEKRSRRVFVSESHMDLEPHPWRGERQVQTRSGTLNGDLYATNAYRVDRELMDVPYDLLLTLPRGTAYPVVQGVDFGVGPFPWQKATPYRYVRDRMERPPPKPAPRTGDPLAFNNAQREHGPATTTSLNDFAGVNGPAPRGHASSVVNAHEAPVRVHPVPGRRPSQP